MGDSETRFDTARDEIRAAGLVCPSCEENIGDVLGRHALVIAKNGADTLIAECRDGRPVDIGGAGYESFQAAVNVACLDAFWFAETIALRRAGLLHL